MGKTISKVCCLFLASIFVVSLAATQAAAITAGQEAPQIQLQSAADSKVSLSDYKGKIVYLDFWASWCPPCRHSLPWMSKLQQKFASEKFAVIAINIDKDSTKAKRIIEEQRINYQVLLDPEGQSAKVYRLPAMPTSYLISEEGVVVQVFSGFNDSSPEEIESAVEKLLAKVR